MIPVDQRLKMEQTRFLHYLEVVHVEDHDEVVKRGSFVASMEETLRRVYPFQGPFGKEGRWVPGRELFDETKDDPWLLQGKESNDWP